MHDQHLAGREVGEQVFRPPAERRRPSCPVSRAAKRSGNGKRRSGRRCSTRSIRAPTIAGSRPRRTVSTSGSSGMSHLLSSASLAYVAYPPARSRYASAPQARSDMQRRPMADETDRDPFRLRTVPRAEKQERVDDVFHKVARRYDLMNDLMSAGLHRAWKDALVSSLRRRSAGRSGISTSPAAPATSPSASSTPAARRRTSRCSTSTATCSRSGASGRRRALRGPDRLRRGATPRRCRSPTRSFDAYTIAFGIRNVPRIEAALAEALSRAEAGRRASCAWSSRSVDVPGLDALYDAYSFNVIPRSAAGRDRRRRALPLPRRVDPQASRARRRSRRMIAAAGFRRVTHRLLTGGIVALHSGWKI